MIPTSNQLGPFQYWPAQAVDLSTDEVIAKYEAGFAGCYADPIARNNFRASVPWPDGWQVSMANDWAGSGAGKLVAPFVFADKVFPGCWPASPQQRGDCVSHGTRNACLLTLMCEIVAGKPDEVTGRLEGIPELPAEGMRDGVLSTEAIYWFRDHGGDGWSCPHAASVACKESGLWLRKNYEELGVDLTRYSGKTAGLYGRESPPAKFLAVGQQHLVRTATELDSFETIRDFLHNGYGVSSCGSEGFSSTRDENGVSNRKGSWAHAMAYIGVDDRQEIKDKYGEPLVCVLNSWGKWNSGPRRVLGTNIEIPEGSFWAKWSDVKRRYAVAFSSVDGWPSKQLPDYGVSWP